MKKHLLLTVACFLFVFTKAQLISPLSMSFGSKTCGTKDSLAIWFKPGNDTLVVKNIRVYHKAFTVSDSAFTVMPGDSRNVWVRFSPKHNLSHYTNLVVSAYVNKKTFSYNQKIAVSGIGVYQEVYYSSTQNLSEEDLKSVLKIITATGQVALGYNGARDKMFMEIDNKKVNGQGASVNTLECVYTGRLVTGYTSRSDAQTSGSLNTEHTWPQSLFSSNNPMVCDLNHLFVTDDNANNKRSNFPFGMVSNPSWQDSSKFNGSIFEPRDTHKGRVGRAMLYFATRYKDDAVTLSFINSQEAILRQWAAQFPPTDIDKKRNEDVFTAQHNRNPYIDHPELLERITSLSGTSVAPTTTLVGFDPSPVVYIAPPGTSSNTVNNFIVVNTGTQPVNLTNIAFKSGHFMLNGSNFMNIPKDSAGEILYSINKGSSPATSPYYDDTLVISTDAANFPVISIPVRGKLDIPPPTTGTISIADRATFQLYPNPSNHAFVVSSKDAAPFDLYLSNLQGEMLIGLTSNTGQAEVNTNNLAAGLYTVRIVSGNEVSIRKMLITH